MSDLNKEYSYKDFTNKSLTDTDPKTWNDTEVVGSCFHRCVPKTETFPKGITGVTFTKCNLDNVVVPVGCKINGGCHRWIGVQKDGEDWILDENLAPVEPINKTTYVKLGLSTSPLSMSAVKLEGSVIVSKRKELEDQLEADHAALDAAADWR